MSLGHNNRIMDLTDEQRSGLRALIRAEGYDGSVSARAQLVLWHAEGHSIKAVAQMGRTTRPTVYKWLDRYERFGRDGLVNVPPPGRPREVGHDVRAQIVALTRKSPPEETGLSHWSSREMATYLKREKGISVSHSFISAVWRDNGLAPHRRGTFKLSRDPNFEAKVYDVVGLYLDPPEGAVVLSLDEKTQVQALDRTQPLLPVSFDKTEKRTHDYVRHGTTNLFAALDTKTGEVIGECRPRRKTSDFLKFMDRVVTQYPDRELHVILDNLSTHSGGKVDKWLAKHPQVTLHYTPIGSSWLNQIEIWFGIITTQAIRRGTFGSLRLLTDKITAYIDSWNQDAKPFTWTATPGEIIAKVRGVHSDVRKLLANNTM